MKYLELDGGKLRVSNIVMGCMRIKDLEQTQLDTLVHTALEAGVNHFDHADIYGGGACEERFGELLRREPGLRDKIVLQSKCGIRPGYYDFSKEHILEAVEGSLRRLSTDHLDILLLHRPDTLMEPEETAEALQSLLDSGKVRWFGVSNHNPAQIQLLQRSFGQKLLFNQMQMSLAHTPMIDAGMTVNMRIDQAIDRTECTLEYCRLEGITVQAWSPFQKGTFGGPFLGDRENYPELNEMCRQLAEKYGVTPTSIAVAWLTRHPANIQVVLGTTNPARLLESCAGSALPLTRAEWYGLYKAAGNRIP